jgi:quaternary ammonium compound-resistance protein SugE
MTEKPYRTSKITRREPEMSWIYLLIAGLFEIGWPLGLKLSQTTDSKVIGIALAVVSMTLSGVFLWLAQRTIPIGTAYAVWTGIGASGTFIVGVLLFREAASLLQILSVMLIIIGVAGLKIFH